MSLEIGSCYRPQIWSWQAAKPRAVKIWHSGPSLSSPALGRTTPQSFVEGQTPQGEFSCLCVSSGLYTRNHCSGTDRLCHRDTRESSWLFSLPQSKDGKDENTPDELTPHGCWCVLTCYSLSHPSCSLGAAGAQKEGHVQTQTVAHQIIKPLMPAYWVLS